jgi:hypothetical protein
MIGQPWLAASYELQSAKKSPACVAGAPLTSEAFAISLLNLA